MAEEGKQTIVVVCPITPPLLREGTTTAEATVGGGIHRHSVAFGGDDWFGDWLRRGHGRQIVSPAMARAQPKEWRPSDYLWSDVARHGQWLDGLVPAAVGGVMMMKQRRDGVVGSPVVDDEAVTTDIVLLEEEPMVESSFLFFSCKENRSSRTCW
jgi:hypothetical protein